MSIKLCVSLYSFQEDYYIGKRDLESCIAAVGNKGIGADGIEVLLEQMPLPSMREDNRVISNQDLDLWQGWLQKHGVAAQSFGADVFTTMYSNRYLTERESIKITMADIRMAAQLGFKVYRTGVFRKEDVGILAACLPLAEDLGIQIATEIHTPRGIHTWWTQDWLEVVLRSGSPAAGFVPDLAIFAKGLSISAQNRLIRDGANPDILAKIDEAYRAHSPLSIDEVKKMGGNTADCSAVGKLNFFIYDDPQWLKEVLPYSKHIHGKFYEMANVNGEDIEPAIDYENAIKVLAENNWDGYISSEYEGQRDYFEQGCDIYMDPMDQVSRHHKMIRHFEAKAKNNINKER